MENFNVDTKFSDLISEILSQDIKNALLTIKKQLDLTLGLVMESQPYGKKKAFRVFKKDLTKINGKGLKYFSVLIFEKHLSFYFNNSENAEVDWKFKLKDANIEIKDRYCKIKNGIDASKVIDVAFEKYNFMC